MGKAAEDKKCKDESQWLFSTDQLECCVFSLFIAKPLFVGFPGIKTFSTLLRSQWKH